jgi:hypothetical protein
MDLMGLRFLPLFLALLLSACNPLATPVPSFDSVALPQVAGVLPGESVWSGEMVLSGDVLVPAGSSLTIEAGTTVYVRPAENTKIDPEYLSSLTELLVRGTLRIAGTAKGPVRFLSLKQPVGEKVAWAGILLDGATGSSIEGASIEGAETGILCIASSPLIRNNKLSGCRYGVVAQKGSDPRILANEITHGEGGVFCWWGSNPYLKGNLIADNEEEAVFVDRTSRPWLDRNEILRNAIGLALYPRDLPYDSTRVTGNGENVRFLGPQGRGGR